MFGKTILLSLTLVSLTASAESNDWDTMQRLDVDENGQLYARPPTQVEINEMEEYISFMKGAPISGTNNRLIKERLEKVALAQTEAQDGSGDKDLNIGRCTNDAGMHVMIYGPGNWTYNGHLYDNTPWIVRHGTVTRDGWDCDGAFLPNNYKSVQGWGWGPLAAKIYNPDSLRVGSGYLFDGWYVQPVKYPSTNWFIPNVAQSQITAWGR